MKRSNLTDRLHKLRMRPSRYAAGLLIYEIAVLMIPNFVLAFTEMWSVWSILSGILLMGGVYMLLNTITRRVGITVMFMLPVIILCALQIVLLYLYGQSIVASDMFVNMMTTNPGEAGELLQNLYPAIITVCIIYGPLLLFAVLQIRRKMRIAPKLRRQLRIAGWVLCGGGLLFMIPAAIKSDRNVVADEVFPLNVMCNIGYALAANQRVLNYESTSAGFSYEAERTTECNDRQIYVYVIGEASRAANWQIYGYERETNPELSQREDLFFFKNVITQSNTTHKSVPLFLSPVHTAHHADLYRCKGLPTLFKEAGFRTYFISNQSPQGAMVDKFAKESDEVIYIGSPRQDMQLLRNMRRIIETDTRHDLFFILHCYGSHFSYYQRYPREYAVFQPDADAAIKPHNIELIRNSYDNSILYTDHFLNRLVEYLDGLSVPSAMLFCADHGEDLFDDERGRFLHASPTITYYQLHVPSFAWFSEEYAAQFPGKVEAARSHRWSPATTHSMFHTIADMALLASPSLDLSVSLVSDRFDDEAERFYLDDHNHAVPFDRKIGITEHDRYMFEIHGIEIGE